MKARNKIISEKENAIFEAVIELFKEGADLNTLTVAEITGRAGIGKGTAYEYFTNKEDMIATALFYKTTEYCCQIYEKIKQKDTLYDKMDLIFNAMEEEIKESNCLLKVLNVMSDNSEISRRLQKMEESKSGEEILPTDMISYILENEAEENDNITSEQMAYLGLEIFSKIICYGMLVCNKRYKSLGDSKEIRKLACEGICREVSAVMESDIASCAGYR